MSEDKDSNEDFVASFVADLEKTQLVGSRLQELIEPTRSGNIAAAEELSVIIRRGPQDLDSTLLHEAAAAYKYHDLNFNLELYCEEIYRRYAAFVTLCNRDDIGRAKTAYQEFVSMWNILSDASRSHFIKQMNLKVDPKAALDQFVARTYKL